MAAASAQGLVRPVQGRAEVVAWLKRQSSVLVGRTKQPMRRPVSSGFAELDALLAGGLPRGHITELAGHRAAGRTSLALTAVSEATRGGAVVAWIDPMDALDPFTVQAAGVCMPRFLWIRPSGRQASSQALKAADLVLGAGGFAIVVLDWLGCRQRGQSPWMRLARRVERTDTSLLLLVGEETGHFSAAMRLLCKRSAQQPLALRVEVTRRRMGPIGGEVVLPLASPVD